MAYLLQGIDPLVAAVFLVPAFVSLAALVLRLACSFSAVNPPDFFPAVLTVILIGVANMALNFFLEVTEATPGLGSHLLAPLLVTSITIALTVRTGPLSAVITAITFVSVCGGAYYSLSVIGDFMLSRMFA